MKKSLISLMILLIGSGFAFSQMKVGVINTQKLVEDSVRGKAMIALLQNFTDSKQKRVKALEEEIQKLDKELMSPALNQATRDSKTLTAQNKRKELQRFYEDTRAEIQQKQLTEMDKITKEVEPIIAAYGKSQKFTMILNHGPNNPLLLYFDDSIDITTAIIKLYDQKHGK